MPAVVDKDIEKKRDAIQSNVQVHAHLVKNHPNAVFASSVDRQTKLSKKEESSAAKLKSV